MTENTLQITFQEREQHRTAARERLRRAEAGERGEAIEQDVRIVVNFEEFDDIDRLMRTSNLELIEAIVSERPRSIRETAAIVGRDYREVHRNLEELQSLGVIEFVTDGQRKKPILREDADSIDFSIRFPRKERRDASGATV